MRTALTKFLGRLLPSPRARRPRGAVRLHVPAGSILRAAGPVMVRCARGSLWVTRPNDPQDHLLSAGQSWHTARTGLVLIQALTPATLTVRAAVDGHVAHVLRPVGALRRAVHGRRAFHADTVRSPLLASGNPESRPGVVH